jgi:hypothetical protein
LQTPAHQDRCQARFQVAFHGSKIMVMPDPNKEKDRKQQSRSTSNRWFEKKGVKAVKVTKESQTIILLRISLICAFRIFFSLPNGVRRSTFDAGLVTKFGAFSSLNIPNLI